MWFKPIRKKYTNKVNNDVNAITETKSLVVPGFVNERAVTCYISHAVYSTLYGSNLSVKKNANKGIME